MAAPAVSMPARTTNISRKLASHRRAPSDMERALSYMERFACGAGLFSTSSGIGRSSRTLEPLCCYQIQTPINNPVWNP
jgi:hypothetical protein